MTYKTEDMAIRRIEALKVLGIWPGYYRVPGGWALTYDPDISTRNEHEGDIRL